VSNRRNKRRRATNQGTSMAESERNAPDVEPEDQSEQPDLDPIDEPEEDMDPDFSGAEDYLDEDNEPMVLTFEEVVVDRLLENEDGIDAISELMNEFELWVDATDDKDALENAVQVVGSISEGLQGIIEKIAEKLQPED